MFFNLELSSPPTCAISGLPPPLPSIISEMFFTIFLASYPFLIAFFVTLTITTGPFNVGVPKIITESEFSKMLKEKKSPDNSGDLTLF